MKAYVFGKGTVGVGATTFGGLAAVSIDTYQEPKEVGSTDYWDGIPGNDATILAFTDITAMRRLARDILDFADEFEAHAQQLG